MRNLTPALAASALLHVALFAFALWRWPDEVRDLTLNAVPVTIVSDVIAEAPEPAPAIEEPAAEAPVEPEPVAPPEPEPVPPPTPQPTPPVKKTQPQPTPPPKKQTQPQRPALDLDALSEDLSRQNPRPAQKSGQGTRQGTQGLSRQGAAEVSTGPALNGLRDKLVRLWNLNCDVPGADEVVVRVGFTLSESGRVIRGPEWLNRSSDEVAQASATRALAAVRRGEPYDDLPEGLYNQSLIVNFDAKTACRNR